MSETPDPCTQCAGVWIRGLTHQHRLSCTRHTPESATIDADYRRFNGTREATETELEIINDHGYNQPARADDRFLIRFTHAGGLHHREVLHGTGPGDNEPARRGPDAGEAGDELGGT